MARNRRKQAMFGIAAALISAAASAAAAGISAAQNRKAQRTAQREADYQNALAQANSLSENINAGYDLQASIDKAQNVVARKGLRRRVRHNGNPSTGGSRQLNMGNGVVADNKGTWVEVQPNVYWNPDGPKHGSEGGINIDQMTKGGKKPLAEMQGGDRNHVGEILDTSDPRQITVISDRVTNPQTGRSFAEDVLLGKDAGEAGDEQESLKRLPRRRNMPRKRAWDGWRTYLQNGWNDFKDWNSLATAGDKFALGASVAGNLASTLINTMAYRNYRAPERPVLYNRQSLDTNYNIAPQLSEIENTRNATNAFVSRNSSSSASARDKIAESNLSSVIEANKLWSTKANQETALRNQNRQYLDAGHEQNAALLNEYRNNLNSFYNARRAAIAGSINQGITGLATSFNNYAANVDTRRQDAINAISTMASGQPETIKYLFNTYPQLANYLGLNRLGLRTRTTPTTTPAVTTPAQTNVPTVRSPYAFTPPLYQSQIPTFVSPIETSAIETTRSINTMSTRPFGLPIDIYRRKRLYQ